MLSARRHSSSALAAQRHDRPPPMGWSARTGRHRNRGLAAVLALGLALFLGIPQSAMAEEAGTESNRLAAGIYPGVQLVGVSFTAEVGVPYPDFDEAEMEALGERVARMAIAGTIDDTDEAMYDAAFKELAEDPEQYMVATSDIRTTTEEIGGFGTGFIVTPDGYIITAAHVVSPDEEELLSAFAESALETFVKEDVAEIQDYIGSGDDEFTPTQAEYLTKALAGFYTNHMSLDSEVEKTVTLQLGTAVTGIDTVRKATPVEVIDVGESYPGKDVAILKIDGKDHLPTLSIGTNDDVDEGDMLHVAGYPVASTFLSGLSESSSITPTVTEGPLTAKKSNESGTPIFQTQAPASPGNSGGPVVNDEGKVIGILVASAVDENGVALEGQEFVIPASVISEKLQQNNVTPQTSDTSQLYNDALDAYFKSYYKRALPLFQQVKNLYPAHPFVDEYITKSESAIQAGKDKTPMSMLTWALIGSGVAFVLLLIIGVLLLILRKRKSAGTPTPVGPGGFGPGLPMGPNQQPGVPGYGQQPGYGSPGYPPMASPDPAPPSPGGPYPPQSPYSGYPGTAAPGGYPGPSPYPQQPSAAPGEGQPSDSWGTPGPAPQNPAGPGKYPGPGTRPPDAPA